MLPALLASLQLSTKDGKAKLELQFGRPDDIKPGLAAAALFQVSRASPDAPPGASRASHGAAPASTQAVDQSQEASNPPAKTWRQACTAFVKNPGVSVGFSAETENNNVEKR